MWSSRVVFRSAWVSVGEGGFVDAMFTSEGVEGDLCRRCHGFLGGVVLHGAGRK